MPDILSQPSEFQHRNDLISETVPKATSPIILHDPINLQPSGYTARYLRVWRQLLSERHLFFSDGYQPRSWCCSRRKQFFTISSWSTVSGHAFLTGRNHRLTTINQDENVRTHVWPINRGTQLTADALCNSSGYMRLRLLRIRSSKTDITHRNTPRQDCVARKLI